MKQKLTLTQLKRYLPLKPPSCKHAFPQKIRRLFLSAAYNNLSYKQQILMKNKYAISYRNYFNIEQIVSHIDKLTNQKYSLISIQMAVRNCAEKYQLADWFLFYRVVNNLGKITQRKVKSNDQYASTIQRVFRSYLKKKKVWLGIQQVEQIRKSLEQKIILEFGLQVLNQIQELYRKRKGQIDKILNLSMSSPRAQETDKKKQKINFIELEQVFNKKLEFYVQKKQIIYLYLRFDIKNIGWFDYQLFKELAFNIKRQVVLQKPRQYLSCFSKLIEDIRAQMKILFYSSDLLISQFMENFNSSPDQQDLKFQDLSQFINTKIPNRYSLYQCIQVFQSIKFKQNLRSLYDAVDLNQLSKLIFKLNQKKNRKRILKQQNQIFYAYKKILFHLVSKCKAKKLDRQGFAKFILSCDPTLKQYGSFFSVYRVYGDLINVQRIKKNCGLNAFSAYLKLKKNDEEFDKIYQNLYQNYPQDFQTPYGKITQKINLQLQFALQSSGVKPLQISQHELVNYRETIKKIFQPEIDLLARTYIHRSIASKFVALYRRIQSVKKKKNLQNAFNFFTKIKVPEQKKQQSKPFKKTKTDKSITSISQKRSTNLQPPKRIYNSQNLQMARQLLLQLISDVPQYMKQLKVHKKISQTEFQSQQETLKYKLSLLKQNSYSFRSNICILAYDELMGLISKGRQIICLNDGKQQKLNIKIPYRPNIQVLTFEVRQRQLIVLTTYLTVQIFEFYQGNQYPLKTIKFGKGQSKIYQNTLQNICKNRQYGAYPKLLKTFQKCFIVNYTVCENKLAIVFEDQSRGMQNIQFTQRQHQFSPEIQKLIAIIKKNKHLKQEKSKTIHKIINFMENMQQQIIQKVQIHKEELKNNLKEEIQKQSQGQFQKNIRLDIFKQNYRSFLAIFQNEEQQLNNQQILSNYQYLNIIKYFIQIKSQYLKIYLKEQFQILAAMAIPEALKTVVESVCDYLKKVNSSLLDVIQNLDVLKEGYIRIKKFKDYLLKITQQSYLIHQKQIDIYLKNLAVGKHITYENFIAIMTDYWKYRFWESPFLIVRDFQFIQTYGLLIYTLDSDKRIFIKNIKDNKIIGILSEHHSVPNISCIKSKMILLSAQSSQSTQHKSINLKVWRLNEDLILKMHGCPPYKMKSFYTLTNCHEKGVTSINYLQNSNYIVTCSLDSTVKFYSIENNPFNLTQIQRIYSQDSLFLSSLTRTINLQSHGINLQVFSTLSINKHINQKNFFKYQTSITLYYIQNLKVKVSNQNKYIPLPKKLNYVLDNYSNAISKKKQKVIQNYHKRQMQILLNTEALSSSLQANLYNALKKSFLYQNTTQIFFIISFLQKKGHGKQFLNRIFKKYGLDILSCGRKKQINYYNPNQPQTIDQAASQAKENFIFVSQQDFGELTQKIKNKANSKGLIDINTLKQISKYYFYGQNQQKLQKIIKQSIQKQKEQRTLISVKNVIQNLKSYKVANQIQKFYSYLRSLYSFLKLKKIPYWKLFSNQRQNISKEKYVTCSFFKQKLQNLNFPNSKTNLIVSFLGNNDRISIFQTMHYLKIALQQEGKNSNIFHQNLSIILNNQSLLLQSKIQQNQKISRGGASQLSLKTGQKSIKSNINLQKIQQEKSLTESNKNLSRSSSKQKLTSRKHSKSKSKQKDKDSECGSRRSRKLSPSNSLGTFTRQISYSNTKDSTKRQIIQIKKKLNQMMNNQNKNIWQLVSSAVPDFIDNPIISQEEYFSIFKVMRSHIKLSQKLQILVFLKNQHHEQLIDLNYFFELLQETTNKKIFYGQKYLITYFVQKLCQQNYSIQQALQIYIFQQMEQLTLEQLMHKCTQYPFKFAHFALRQFEQILISQNKAGFIKEDIIDLIQRIVQKYNLKLESKSITFVQQVLFKIDRKKEQFQNLFPKTNIVTQQYFINCVKNINSAYEKNQILKDFQNIKMKVKQNIRKKSDSNPQSQRSNKSSRSSAKNIQIPYAIFKYQLQNLLSQARQSTDKQRESARKLVRMLSSKKISLFNYFSSLDLQKRYYLNQNQFQTGLTQLGIHLSFWKAISKKNQKRLYYIELIKYLIDTNILNYKCVDSQLQIAMQKLIKKVIRNFDIQQIYQKMRDKQNTKTNQTTLKTFRQFALSANIFNQKQIVYLFAAFCNSQQIKNSKFSNDQIIKNEQNLHKTFNYKMFLDVISLYKAQTITKTPQFKLVDYLKKRNISLVNEFQKFMQKNKKNKEIAQCLKKKSTAISKEILIMFLTQIKAALSERQLKEVVQNFPSQLQFSFFNERLQQIYKKGSSCIDKQEAGVYLQSIYKKSKELNVSIQRLFADFSQDKKGKLRLKDLNQLCQFIQCGLNKIQIKKIFNELDLQHKGFCTLSQMLQAIDGIRQKIQKQEDQYELDYIIEKIFNNSEKFILKQSRISLPFDRFCNILNKVLIQAECEKVYNKLKGISKSADITEHDMKNYIQRKKLQINMKNDKKYKELVLNLLKIIRKNDIDINQMFKYFSNGSQNPVSKANFLVLYQSLQSKTSILDINNLYVYLDENKSGHITIQRWEQKLGIVDLQNDNIQGTTEQLKVFYKVKIFLSQVYLVFIQKMFKPNQIYHFFDKHGNGVIKYQQFWNLIIQLGIATNQQLQRKIINYLDRNKQKHIQISILIQQLQNCMGKKQKVILQTKTSFIFKRNQQVFQTKYTYFINELIKKEEFIDINQVSQSCITQSDFFYILKRFGLYLAQDEITDIRRNFFAKQNYLHLYPIYFMLKNIFQNSQVQNIEQSKKQLFLRLMRKMIENKITLKTIQNIKTNDQMIVFLKQLKIFTPVEIEILIQEITLDNSSAIDFQKMKFKVRDSYISPSFNLDQTIMFADNDINKLLRQNLRKLAKFQVNYLKIASSNRIDQEQFSDILNKIGLVFTKKQIHRYFTAFSYQKNFISIQNLLSEKQNQINQTKREGIYIVKQQQQKDQNQNNFITEQDVNIFQDHIRASIKFKSITLYKALEDYFLQNYGFVNISNLKLFLVDIGYQIEKQKQSKVFYYFYIKNQHKFNKQQQVKVKQLENILQIQQNEDDKLTSDSVNQAHSKQQNKQYHITSSKIKSILFILNQRKTELIIWMQHNQIQKMSLSHLYQFMLTFQKDTNIIKLCCSLFHKQFEVQELYERVNELIRQHFIYQKSNQIQQIQDLDLFKFIESKNFIQIYHQQLQNFINNVKELTFGQSNLYRLSFNLVIQYILTNQHLMMIKPILTKSSKNYISNKLLIFQQIQSYNHLVINNPGMIIQSQKIITQNNLILINQKYLGLPSTRKQQFQHFLRATSSISLPKVIRSKHFFMWEPNTRQNPRGGISFRWKYIPSFASKILKQLQKLHKVGYCCPNLRYSEINSDGIQNLVYPCQIDPSGKLTYFYKADLIDFQDPYCVPQLFNEGRSKVTVKCDSWIFGCLLYQFIWGHPPNSYFVQLHAHLKKRNLQQQFQQIILMKEQPNQYFYRFYNSEKILETYQRQFFFQKCSYYRDLQFNINSIQSFRGIFLPLQLLFDRDYRHFKEQFNLLIKLHDVIFQCLQPNPKNRPTIQEIAEKSVFQDIYDIDTYFDNLLEHQSIQELQKYVIYPLIKQSNLQSQNILTSVKKLEDVLINLTLKKINPYMTLPKSYPWPKQSKGVFTNNVLKNKDNIRQTFSYNQVVRIFKSFILDKIVCHWIDLKAQKFNQTQVDQIEENICQIFTKIIRMFRSYEFPGVGFVNYLLNSIIKFIFQEKEDFIYIQNNAKQIQQHTNIYSSTKSLKKYLKLPIISSKRQQFLQYLKQVIYITGNGNPQYLPICGYLQEHQEIKELFQYFYSCIDLLLNNRQKSQLTINYFRDRIYVKYDDSCVNISQFKIQLLILKCLRQQQKLKNICWSYLSQYIQQNITEVENICLFKSQIFYMFISSSLRDPLQSISIKLIICNIVAHLLTSESDEIVEIMSSPVCNVFSQLVRLMIQPPKDLTSHQQYQSLRWKMQQIAQVIKKNWRLSTVVQNIEGGLYVLKLWESSRLIMDS